jgi:hypothetical protein
MLDGWHPSLRGGATFQREAVGEPEMEARRELFGINFIGEKAENRLEFVG